jgi:hypothetical protein
MLDQIAALRTIEIRDQAAAGGRRNLIPRLTRFLSGHLATAGWSWLTIAICAPPPDSPTGDRRRTGS